MKFRCVASIRHTPDDCNNCITTVSVMYSVLFKKSALKVSNKQQTISDLVTETDNKQFPNIYKQPKN